MSSESPKGTLFIKTGEIDRKYVGRYYYAKILGTKNNDNGVYLSRLLFIPASQNNDFDYLFADNEEYKEHKIKILNVVLSLEIHRISSFSKSKYKEEISKINEINCLINRSAMETISYLATLNDDVSLSLSLDVTESDRIVKGGKKIKLSRKDIDNIIKMTDQMNHRFKMVIRGSKKMDQNKIRNVLPSGQGIKNFTEKKEKYYKLFKNLNDLLSNLFSMRIENDWNLSLEYDTLGFFSNKNDKIVAIHPFLSEYESLEPFVLSKSFNNGNMKGSTFILTLSIMNHYYRINQWYFILVLLSNPLQEIYEENGINTKKELIVTMTGEVSLIDILENKENLILIKQSIKRNIQKRNVFELQNLLDQTGAKLLYNPFSRNMSIMNIFDKSNTSKFTYKRNEETGSLFLDSSSNESVIDSLKEKESFNKNKPTTCDFYRFFAVTMEELNNDKINKNEMEKDYLSIKLHNQRVVELRNDMRKMLLVDFIKKETKKQIDKLNQIGAHHNI